MSKSNSRPRVAIVCDWLTGIGGAERVVLELHRMYPEAPIFTSQYDPSKIDWFTDADVRTTWLQKLPSSLKKFLPLLRAITFSRLDLSDYDLVLSSSGAEAKGVHTGNNTIHITYCHTPTHYYWIRPDEYLQNPGFPRGLNWLARLGLKLLASQLKRWDLRAAKKPDYFIANSVHTKEMIKRYYKRDAEVIAPPVEVDRFKASLSDEPRHGFVTAGRQTPYKRFDLAIKACEEIKVPLVVIGDGPEHRQLEKLAGRSTTFLTQVNDNDIIKHFRSAIAFILPNMDDFGIVAVEALAAGTPVIAYNKGGALDYIKPNSNGLLFTKQTPGNLASVLEVAASKNWNYQAIPASVQHFSVGNFTKSMQNYINSCLTRKVS